MLKNFQQPSQDYLNSYPYPHLYMDDALDNTVALSIQKEILYISQSIHTPENQFDRYDNPFESKFTLRNKYTYPPVLNSLMTYLTTEEYVQYLSNYIGVQLFNDPNRNFWGVHVYEDGDKLDIHTDAGLHPVNGMKKHLTLGIYLSLNYTDKNGCALEIWNGSSCMEDKPVLYNCITHISPLFNRLIMFNCCDNAWHGNPSKMISNVDTTTTTTTTTTKRIFITLSYLSQYNGENYKNLRKKAFFIKLPDEPEDEEKDKLRLLRADEKACKNIYRTT